jgi:sulfane dehydrogenase subunit SoxC
MAALESVPKGTVAMENVTQDELGLATRNHGFLLETLRYPVTPVGLHYLLIHYDVPHVDETTWELAIGGRVQRPCQLTLQDLRARPAVTERVTMECAGNGRMAMSPRPLSQPWGVEAVGTGEWTGTPLRPLLEEAGVLDDAVEVVFTGLDAGIENGVEQRYARSLPMAEALREDVLLVYELNGQALPVQHGYPLRLVVPGWYGMGNVKWLSDISIVNRPFDGYQQTHAYRWRTEQDESGTPLSRMVPRALMIPPGIPDFLTRDRHLAAGPALLEGRAWSGHAPMQRVEVSTDGGRVWGDAVLEPQVDRYAWVGWSYRWQPSPGTHELLCRATDQDGNTQPLQAEWNLGGYAGNAVQRVTVTVDDG